MGQKMDPHGLRVGVIKDWSSKWYADSKNFGDYLVEDNKIRKYIKKKLYISGISKIEIERTAKFVKINVFTAKPGLVIGKGGNLAETLKVELQKMINKDVNLNSYYIVISVTGIDAREKLNQYTNYIESILAPYKPKLLKNNTFFLLFCC